MDMGHPRHAQSAGPHHCKLMYSKCPHVKIKTMVVVSSILLPCVAMELKCAATFKRSLHMLVTVTCD